MNLAPVSKSWLHAALAAGLWLSVFCAWTAPILIDGGLTPYAAYLSTGRLITCAMGAALCWPLALCFARLEPRAAGVRIGLTILLCDLAAIVWAAAARTAVMPLLKVAVPLFEAATLSGQALPENGPILSIGLIFLAWAGLRFLADRALGSAEAPPAPAYADELWANAGRGARRIPAADILWLEAERDYVRVHAVDGSGGLTREPLHALLGRLDPARFLRVHRSAAIGLEHLRGIDPRPGRGLVLILAGGARVPVGRSHVAEVRALAGGPPRNAAGTKIKSLGLPADDPLAVRVGDSFQARG